MGTMKVLHRICLCKQLVVHFRKSMLTKKLLWYFKYISLEEDFLVSRRFVLAFLLHYTWRVDHSSSKFLVANSDLLEKKCV